MTSITSEREFGPVVDGDTSAFLSSLYRRHYRSVYRVCLGSLRSHHDAEDALQQTFVNALRAIEAGVRPRSEVAWLSEIARNVCFERHRGRKRRAKLETITSPDDLGQLAGTATRAGEGGSELGGALGCLDQRQRTALVLREWRGLSYKEIGAMLHLSQAGSEALVSRARRTVARALESGLGVRPCLNLIGILFSSRRLWAGGSAKTCAVVACGATIVAAPALEHHLAQRHHGSQGRQGVLASPGQRPTRAPTPRLRVVEHVRQDPTAARRVVDGHGQPPVRAPRDQVEPAVDQTPAGAAPDVAGSTPPSASAGDTAYTEPKAPAPAGASVAVNGSVAGTEAAVDADVHAGSSGVVASAGARVGDDVGADAGIGVSAPGTAAGPDVGAQTTVSAGASQSPAQPQVDVGANVANVANVSVSASVSIPHH